MRCNVRLAQPHRADAALLRQQEQRHVRVAKAVDRLHRVADQEQRAPVVGLPARRQQLEQAPLRLRRVLELIDEQMLDAAIEREQQLRRRVDVPERALRRERELDEVDGTPLGEDDFELGSEAHEDDAQRVETSPLRFRVARVRQRASRLPVRRATAPRSCSSSSSAPAVDRAAAACCGPKPSVLVGAFAPVALLRQQQGGDAAPRGERDGARRRRTLEREPWLESGAQRVAGCAGGVPQQRRQFAASNASSHKAAVAASSSSMRRCKAPSSNAPQRFRAAREQTQPLIAPRQQRGEQFFEPRAVVAEIAQQEQQTRAQRLFVAGDSRYAATRRFAMQILRLVDDVGCSDTVGQHWQLAREPGVERVQRVDAQALRLREHLPLELAIASDDGPR